MAADLIFESVPNFSEGRRGGVIDAITSAAAGPAHLLDVHSDVDHNRSVVSLAGSKAHLLDGLVAAVAQARDLIDLRSHSGVHPRVGAADVVPIIPLRDATIDDASERSRELAERIWAELRVPVFFYGYGSRALADIRGGRATPDVGGPAPHPTAGAVCVGARQALVAFNVVVRGLDLAGARAVARSLRESGGGLRGVQALAFGLPDGRVQLSMNLFRLHETRPVDVVAELERRGVEVDVRELVGLCPAHAAGSGVGDGALLEGRLAAAAARTAAFRCRARGGEEHTALGARLEREAGELAQLGADQQWMLAGAERAAALRSVLPAAGVMDPEVDAMLAAAAAGLREAITPATASLYRARVAALEARLA